MGLCAQALFQASLNQPPKQPTIALNTSPPLNFQYEKGYEIPTKHKEAMRQLRWFGKVPVCAIIVRNKLSDTTVRKILSYPYPE